MRPLRLASLLGVTTLVFGAGAALSAPAQEVVFTSNQFTPVTEQEWARNTLLPKFTEETGIRVQFTTENEGPYVDLLLWGENIKKATGQRRIGFPAGPRGLYGRFLHGYVYPSFTGSQVKRFKSAEAVEMWRYLRHLWGVTHPSSFTYEFMAQPLLLGEVWVAWDHIARILPALQERSNDFVVLPSPAGPKGRSFLSVIVGLAIPKTADNPDLGERLIEYLTRPSTQVITAQGVAFFPVSPEAAKAAPTGGLKVVADGVSAQAGAPDGRTALLPVGLGARTGEFVPLYVDTFRRVAIQGEDIQKVLADQGAKLDELYRATNAPCAPPDPPQRPCVPD